MESTIQTELEKRDSLLDERSQNTLPEAIALRDFMAMAFEDEIPVVADLFDLGRKVMIVGKSKLGKTYFALSLGLHLAMGQDLCQLKIPNCLNVLYINYELHEQSLWKRLKKMLQTHGENCSLDQTKICTLNLRGYSCDTDVVVQHIIEQAKKNESQVIILDPLYLLVDGNENDSSTILSVVRMMDRIIKETAAAFVYVHHDTKGTYPGEKSNVDRGSGSGLLGRHWDAQIALSEHAESEGAVVLDFTSRDYHSLASITLERKEGCLVCSGLPPDKRTRRSDLRNEPSYELKTSILHEAANYILENSTEMGLRTSEVLNYITEKHNLSDRQGRKLLGQLNGNQVPAGGILKLNKLGNNHNYFTVEKLGQ